MDDRLEEALKHANYKATLMMSRKNLELRFRNDLVYSINGGVFTVTPELICFADALGRNNEKDVVLIDDKGNPIRIEDIRSFATEIVSIYFKAANAYHAGFEKLKKARTVKSITEV